MKRLLTGVLLCMSVVFVAVNAEAAAIDDLIAQLHDKDSDVRRRAAKEIAEAGPDAKNATAALVKALKDEDLFVRRFSAETLGVIGADPKIAVPGLSAVLSNEKERKEVQEAAATSLGKLGPGGSKALIEAAKDQGKDASVRKRALDSLGAIGPDAHTVVADLTDLMTGKVKNGKKADPVAAANDVRLEVASALGNIANSKDDDAIKALEDVSGDKGNKKNKELKQAVNKAIKDIKARN
jgi:HEAT repeat protein